MKAEQTAILCPEQYLILYHYILLTKWLSLKQKMHVELEVTRLYTR